MKKYFLIFGLILSGCGSFIKAEPGSEELTRIDAEPIGCKFLYKMDADAAVYDSKDAERYLRNRIVNQSQQGNTYWMISQRTKPIEDAIFGPKQSFIMTANVYDCPNPDNVIFRKNHAGEMPSSRTVFGGV